jgi:hypothetical protein
LLTAAIPRGDEQQTIVSGMTCTPGAAGSPSGVAWGGEIISALSREAREVGSQS